MRKTVFVKKQGKVPSPSVKERAELEKQHIEISNGRVLKTFKSDDSPEKGIVSGEQDYFRQISDSIKCEDTASALENLIKPMEQ